ncbi:hypothetical protein [Breoghania sp. L-A4]|uniref:hypothetical protein n=1 Tax=Breoghania sp. L-A4 TaxID=2304600 RepID=UPI0019675E06
MQADPRRLAGQMRVAAGLAMLAVAGVLVFTGRWAFALPLGAFALSLLGWGGVPGFGRVGGGAIPADSGRRCVPQCWKWSSITTAAR